MHKKRKHIRERSVREIFNQEPGTWSGIESRESNAARRGLPLEN